MAANSNRSKLTPSEALTYIRGGRGAATIVGRDHQFVYSFSKGDEERSPIFVRTTTGDSTYLGFLTPDLELIAGRKGDASHPAFKAIAWYINKALQKPEIAERVQFWHEGRCCMCGRPLTHPASIASGIGPDCAGKTHHEHYAKEAA